ncbi:14991_t:CDS:2 [Funneliformis mosseae]|uniref:14991_t:CDS:1 n=1 Tax=Funneliformis mosseae TaxID=27381 RepID=A0A9N9DYS1_FUNMO|nr:14991_t:CDS:2 [Funneliformis mosseae]
MSISSSSKIYEHIKFCITSSNSPCCLSKKVRRKSRLINFIYDVLNIALGIRTAHLVDVTSLTYEETTRLIASLRQEIPHICGIQFSDTHVFICNQDLLSAKLKLDLDNEFKDIAFIDVSKKNVEPTQVNVPDSLMHLLSTQFHPFTFQENSDSTLFVSQTPQCMISFTGWILEYPVIYVLESSSTDDESSFCSQNIMMNCLGSQELILYRIFLKKNMKSTEEIQRHMLLSFSCPVSFISSFNNKPNKDIISARLNNIVSTRVEQNKSFWNKGLELEVISAFSEPLNLNLTIIKPYQIARVPPNNGTWITCGSTQTNNVSYSLVVVPPLTPITNGFGASAEGNNAPLTGGGSGVYVYLVDYENSQRFPNIAPIPSLSCYSDEVTYCNHDSGTTPLVNLGFYYCLIVQNPYATPQKVAVAFSDTVTVFGNGGFTSPDGNGETGANGMP